MIAEPHRGSGNAILWGAIGLLATSSLGLLALWLTDTHLSPAGTGAVAGAAVSGIIAIALATLGYAERRADARARELERRADKNERELERTEGYVIQSFQFFTGGTQRRGVGVSAVEGLLSQAPHLRSVFVPLLVNQATYVLTKVPESRQPSTEHAPDAQKPLTEHEKDNLNRMIAVLARFRPGDTEHEQHYANLLDAISRKRQHVQGETERWLADLNEKLDRDGAQPTERSTD